MSEVTKPAANDWRRQGQESFLKGVKFIERDYWPHGPGWDHDHCEFCGAKFSLQEGDLKKGYSTEEGYHWICHPCFKGEFNWDVENEN